MQLTHRRIILIWEHRFLHDAVQALLNQAGLHLVCDYNTDVPIDQIAGQTPSHILVEAGVPWCDQLLVKLLQMETVIIIRLNLNNNQLQVFKRLHRDVTQASDLVDLLLEAS